MPNSGLDLTEECFNEHLQSFRFREGVITNKWGLHACDELKWPKIAIWVSAPPRNNGPERFYLLFDLEGYPTNGPTARLWNPETKKNLEDSKRPKGAKDVDMIFRTNWNNGNALYAPWDRLAIKGHTKWKTQFPGLVWTSSHTIVDYLNPTCEALHSDDYHGL